MQKQTKEVNTNTPLLAAEIAIGNLKSLFECSVLISEQRLRSEEVGVIFDAFCDEHISLELNGKRYRYDWLLFSTRQNWAQSTFQNLDTEVLDRTKLIRWHRGGSTGQRSVRGRATGGGCRLVLNPIL
jgi:hypothetical protein